MPDQNKLSFALASLGPASTRTTEIVPSQPTRNAVFGDMLADQTINPWKKGAGSSKVRTWETNHYHSLISLRTPSNLPAMPTYDYECDACGHALELFQGINDPMKKKCPECGKKQAETTLWHRCCDRIQRQWFLPDRLSQRRLQEGCRCRLEIQS